MQFITTISLLLAATATAFEHKGHARLHRRHGGFGFNSSSSALTTTSTPQITLTPTISLSTGGGYGNTAPKETPLPPNHEVVTETVDTTLTYTKGVGPSATVVTTTIHATSTRTVLKTVLITRPAGAQQTAIAGDNVNKENAAGNGANGVNSAEPTTTIRQTSVFTKVVTVYNAKPTQAAGAQVSGNAANPTDGVCEAPKTVYTTVQETVYVTAGAQKAVETGSAQNGSAQKSNVQHVEQPKQSSVGAFYPNPSVQTPGQGVGPTGFTTLHPKPTGYGRRL